MAGWVFNSSSGVNFCFQFEFRLEVSVRVEFQGVKGGFRCKFSFS